MTPELCAVGLNVRINCKYHSSVLWFSRVIMHAVGQKTYVAGTTHI